MISSRVLALSAVFAISSLATAQQASFTLYGSSCNAPSLRAPGHWQRRPTTHWHHGHGHIRGAECDRARHRTYRSADVVVRSIQNQRSDPPSFCLHNLRTAPSWSIRSRSCRWLRMRVVACYVTSLDLPIPNDTSLVGGALTLQWMTPHHQCFLVGCGLGWVVFSEGAEAVIGL